jgi:hypothetical protein
VTARRANQTGGLTGPPMRRARVNELIEWVNECPLMTQSGHQPSLNNLFHSRPASFLVHV